MVDPTDIDRDGRVPACLVDLPEPAGGFDAGIINENVYAAEGFDRGGGESIDLGGVADVGRYARHGGTVVTQLARQSFNAGRSNIGEHGAHPPSGDGACDSRADSRPGSGHDGNIAIRQHITGHATPAHAVPTRRCGHWSVLAFSLTL